MSNRVQLSDIEKMELGKIAELPPDQLELLIQDASDMAKTAKQYGDWLSGALAIRYGDLAKAARKEAGKDTGVVHLTDGPDGEFDIECDLPKKVEWNGEKLVGAFDAMTDEDARHYCKATFAVEEKKYDAAPPAIKKLLEPARTVKAGKPTFKLGRKKETA